MGTTNCINAEFSKWMQNVIKEWDRAGDRFTKRMWDRMTIKDIVE